MAAAQRTARSRHSETRYGTGLRIQEWSSVLTLELPTRVAGGQFQTAVLSGARSKGGAGSKVLLSGEAVGPLTGIRPAELAGVKRHRLVHDNPDIAAAFKQRAAATNRTKPEVDALQKNLKIEKSRNCRLVQENFELRTRLELYASRIAEHVSDRDKLLAAIESGSKIQSMKRAG